MWTTIALTFGLYLLYFGAACLVWLALCSVGLLLWYLLGNLWMVTVGNRIEDRKNERIRAERALRRRPKRDLRTVPRGWH